MNHTFTTDHASLLARATDWVTFGELVGGDVTAIELDLIADLVRWRMLEMDDQRRYRRTGL